MYEKTFHCKQCRQTVTVTSWGAETAQANLTAEGWTSVIKDGIVTKTLCPTCSVPPPPVPGSVVQSLLERIETTVESPCRRRLDQQKKARNARAEHFRQHDPERTAADYIRRLESCSEQFALFSVDGELVIHPMRCRLRACPICEAKRMSSWWHKLQPLVKAFSAPKHVTLTLRSSDDPLDAQLRRLTHSFRKLRQRTLWKRRNPWGMWLIEVTFNEKTGRWHPHLHVIVNMAFLSKEALSEAWGEVTGDSFIVGVKAVRSNLANYLCKYIAKASSIYLAPVDPFTVNALLKGKRLVQPFGTWPALPALPDSKVKFLGTVAEMVYRARQGDPRARAMCAIVRERCPEALYAACTLPRPPELPARLPKRQNAPSG